MGSAIASFSAEKVYTFCFWGISQFLDIMKWNVVGAVPGVNLHFNRLCGSPPVYLTMYELPDLSGAADKRHLKSRKFCYFHVAVWSALHPPKDDGGGEPQAPIESLADFLG